MMPPMEPETTDHHTAGSRPAWAITNQAATMKMTGAPRVPKRRATAGSLSDMSRTKAMPISEQISPAEASMSGRPMSVPRAEPSSMPGARSVSVASASVEAMAMVAIMEPQ